MPFFAPNALAYCLQLAIVVGICAGVPRLLRVHAPGLQYLFWRCVLGLALVLPFAQPWMQLDVSTAVLTVNSAQGHAAAPPFATAADGFTVDERLLAVAAVVLIAGIIVRLAFLSIGLARLRRLRVNAEGDDAGPEFADLQQWIGTRAAIRWSARTTHPVTFGWRRPVVLLPGSVRALDRAAARALVAHELFHVRRGDWAWQIAEEVVRAVFWFHPAMWWLVSRVQLARETVVDELSILATNSRRAYMDTLLAFADESGPLPASAFSRRRHLFHRIMLLSREASMSATRVTFASLVLAAALVGSSAVAVSAFPLIQQPRDPVPGQLSPQQRAVLDQAVERARAALAREPNAPDLHNNLAVALRDRTVRDPELTAAERMQNLREAIASEDAALQIRPDYAAALKMKVALLRQLAGSTTDPAERGRALAAADAAQTTMHAALAPQTPDAADFQAQVEAANPLRIGGNIKAPLKIKDVKPVYPPEAQSAHISGVVIIEALIDKTGHVASVQVLRSIPGLDDAALDAVRQWQYVPTLLNGAPVNVVMTVTVNFTLQ
jgi:TonB family protein